MVSKSCEGKTVLSRSFVAIVAAAAISGAVPGMTGLYHRVRYRAEHGRYPPLGLHAEVTVWKASIGIPGITKMYEGTLTNYGLLPVRVTACDYLDDASSRGVQIAYGIERWNAITRRWEIILQTTATDFCKPYPLGIAEGNIRRRWLWPGQRLSSGEEATAARGPFQKGDKARFVLFSAIEGIDAQPLALATAPFEIDEQVAVEGVGFRVRH